MLIAHAHAVGRRLGLVLVALGLAAVALVSQQVGHTAHTAGAAGGAVSAEHAAVDLDTAAYPQPGGSGDEHPAEDPGTAAEHVCAAVLLVVLALPALPSARPSDGERALSKPGWWRQVTGPTLQVVSPGVWDTPGVLRV